MPIGMKEFVDFLSGQPPFDALDPEDLARLAAHLEVEYFAPGAVVVREDERLDHLWVVRTGALEVLDKGQVVDLLGPGDTVGHVALLSRLPHGLLVRAHEESLCLRLPDPRGYLAHPQRLSFARIPAPRRPARLIADSPLRGATAPLRGVVRPVVWCAADDPVREVARAIGATGHTCALVRTGDGLGIVTDHDFRRRVATGEVPLDAPVRRIATVPALTIAEDATRAAGLVQMVEHGVHHLVVTDRAGEPVGVIRVVDLAQVEVRDPLLIRSAIEGAETAEALAEVCRSLPGTLVALHDRELPAAHIGQLHAAIVDAVVRRAVALRPDPLAGLRHSWVLLGSLARREPLPRSDIDTALVWADPEPSAPDPAGTARAAAAGLLEDLRRCGLRPCPNGANADNPMFSRAQSDWARAARGWIRDPTAEGALLLSAMVADSRPLTEVPLGLHMTDSIRSHTRTHQFLRALLDEALAWHPPTGFVREFIVHHTGEHRGQLDLKRGGLAPVVALGRWLAIAVGDSRGTTPQRLRRGAAAGLLTADEAQTLTGGYESVYALVLDHEIAALRAGGQPETFIAPRDLDTLTRRHLRETFRAIIRVQERLDQDWARRLPA
jgi:CBS domain-containing protein